MTLAEIKHFADAMTLVTPFSGGVSVYVQCGLQRFPVKTAKATPMWDEKRKEHVMAVVIDADAERGGET